MFASVKEYFGYAEEKKEEQQLEEVDLSKKDEESVVAEKLKYPLSIPFIIVNEFCERYSYFGMRTVLVLYLTEVLMFSENGATIIYHTFVFLSYLFCIFGALLSDSFLGKFRTILILSVFYACGSLLVTLGSIGPWHLPAKEFTMIGLFVIAMGSGGIKPCVAAFGGDQFKLPEQQSQMAGFFSVFYFAINCGALISTFATPMFREHFQCFGEENCYMLAFIIPAVLMVGSIVIFVVGYFVVHYKIVPSHGRMVTKIVRCISSAIRTRSKEKTTNPRNHWLDYADKEHSGLRIMEAKILLRILLLYLPLPIFWGLFEQQGSTWILQAKNMTGDIGFMELTPDQMISFNPLLIMIFIPISEIAIYPLFSLIGIRSPLQRMATGMFFACIAFVMAGILDVYIMAHPDKSVHMLWQIPQYVVLTLAEVMFAVTGLKFTYSEAPVALKSILQGCWFLTSAIGNCIVVGVESLSIFGHEHGDRYKEFFLYAGLILADILLFSYIAHKYTPISMEDKMKAQEEHDAIEAEKKLTLEIETIEALVQEENSVLADQ